MKICRVKSNTNPDRWYLIQRHGKTLKQGGDGVLWTCQCSKFVSDGKTCSHLKAFFKAIKGVETLPQDKFKLLYNGKRLFVKPKLSTMDKAVYLGMDWGKKVDVSQLSKGDNTNKDKTIHRILQLDNLLERLYVYEPLVCKTKDNQLRHLYNEYAEAANNLNEYLITMQDYIL